ncbi:MAG: hypothetical protein RIC03_06960 [Cyclobacteriaceae bacterium]
MEQFQGFIGWLVGIIALFLGGLMGAFKWLQTEFNIRDAKISALDSKISKVESGLKLEMEQIKSQIQLNGQKDEHNHAELMREVKSIFREINGMREKQEEWRKVMENLFYQNPDLKKPQG